ncbi:MAG TPA: NADH-quinone oxidoreductase subunit M [Cyclobacteriaceae bacterium]|jgi:NADH-quinone oxidoreductase subunit M
MALTLLIFWPLAAAIVVMALKTRYARTFASFAAILELLISLWVVLQFRADASTQFETNVPWIASLGIQYHVGLDGISLLLVLLTTGLTPFIVWASNTARSRSFYALMLVMEMALVGVFSALDGFLFYVFWELALIPIYILCLRWGTANSGAITLKFFIYTLAGSLLMLVALIYVYFHTPAPHTFDIQALYDAARGLPGAHQRWIFWALFIAFAIKMPVFPFHTWQPDTYQAAPAQGTMLLSGIMLKMGVYGLIRWLLPLVPLGVQAEGTTALTLAVIGIVFASCIAIVQKDLKRLVAYSSMAHVGLIAAGILTLDRIGIQGAMIQMISHGIIVVALFYVIDIIQSRLNTEDMTSLGAIRLEAPVFATVFMIVLLGSIALPLTSGFVGEFMLINSLFRFDTWLGVFGALTMILGAVYMLRSYQVTVLGESREAAGLFADLTTQERLVLYPLVLLVLVLGVFPSPVLKLSEAAVDSMVTMLQQYYTMR